MKKRYSKEQIIGAIKEHESGVKVDDICRSMGIAAGTFYNWRSRYARFEVNEAKRLKRARKRKPQAQKATSRKTT